MWFLGEWKEAFGFHNWIWLITIYCEPICRLARVGQRTQNFLSLPNPPPIHPNGLIGQAGVSFHSLLRDFRRKESDYLKKSSGDGVDPADGRILRAGAQTPEREPSRLAAARLAARLRTIRTPSPSRRRCGRRPSALRGRSGQATGRRRCADVALVGAPGKGHHPRRERAAGFFAHLRRAVAPGGDSLRHYFGHGLRPLRLAAEHEGFGLEVLRCFRWNGGTGCSRQTGSGSSPGLRAESPRCESLGWSRSERRRPRLPVRKILQP